MGACVFSRVLVARLLMYYSLQSGKTVTQYLNKAALFFIATFTLKINVHIQDVFFFKEFEPCFNTPLSVRLCVFVCV